MKNTRSLAAQAIPLRAGTPSATCPRRPPQKRAENGLTRSWRDLFRRTARGNRETPPRERPSTSHADNTLNGVNRAWRRKIVSRTAGLRPHIDPSHDHLRGDEAAAVTLVEYGDYESPSCIAAASELARLRAHFDGKVRLAFRHFPIGDAHPLALHVSGNRLPLAGPRGNSVTSSKDSTPLTLSHRPPLSVRRCP